MLQLGQKVIHLEKLSPLSLAAEIDMTVITIFSITESSSRKSEKRRAWCNECLPFPFFLSVAFAPISQGSKMEDVVHDVAIAKLNICLLTGGYSSKSTPSSLYGWDFVAVCGSRREWKQDPWRGGRYGVRIPTGYIGTTGIYLVEKGGLCKICVRSVCFKYILVAIRAE